MKKGSVIILISVFIILLISSFNDKSARNAANLGELLFSDPILSKDRSISCASCHIPGFAFADTAALSTGVFGRKGKRNSPSAMNVLLRRNLFWDGRVNTLEEQALLRLKIPMKWICRLIRPFPV